MVYVCMDVCKSFYGSPTRARTNTPSDEYDSYREYRVANILFANTIFFSEAINFII